MLIFARAVLAERPDVVYFWNQSGLSFWLAPWARLLQLRCVFFISDTAFRSWRIGAFLRRFMTDADDRDSGRLANSWLVQGYPVTQGVHCQFASDFLRGTSQETTARRKAKNSPVIHWGVNPARFAPQEEQRPDGPLRLLYVGQVIPEKGVHTAIDAVAGIVGSQRCNVTLTIAGGSSKPAYLAEQQSRVVTLGLTEAVRFVGQLERTALAELYRTHDVLVFASIWDEPFAITPLEAMAAGLAVVATNTGGSSEVFKDRENCLLFPAGDAAACAEAIITLSTDGELRQKIRRQGRQLVLSTFTLEGMIDQIERDLTQVVA